MSEFPFPELEEEAAARFFEYFHRMKALRERLSLDERERTDALSTAMIEGQCEIAREALRDFAGNADVESYFVHYLSLSREYWNEESAVYERLIEQCSDAATRAKVRADYALLLAKNGEVERALEIADPLPETASSRTVILPEILSFRDKGEAREAALRSVQALLGHANYLMRRYGIADPVSTDKSV